MDRSRYPDRWEEFSRYIRFDRAGGFCEWCGAENGKPHPVTGSRVVLTVAHLDYAGGVCDCEARTGRKCAEKGHVRALCQLEHLRIDVPRHRFNARRTRAARAGQIWLGDLEAR